MTWRHGGDGVLVIVALIALGRLIAFQLSCQVQPTEGCNCNCNCNISTKATTSTSKRHLTSARVPCECLADESCSSAAHSHCKVIQEKKKKKLHYISALTSWWCGVCVCVCVYVCGCNGYAYVLCTFSMTSPCYIDFIRLENIYSITSRIFNQISLFN